MWTNAGTYTWCLLLNIEAAFAHIVSLCLSESKCHINFISHGLCEEIWFFCKVVAGVPIIGLGRVCFFCLFYELSCFPVPVAGVYLEVSQVWLQRKRNRALKSEFLIANEHCVCLSREAFLYQNLFYLLKCSHSCTPKGAQLKCRVK